MMNSNPTTKDALIAQLVQKNVKGSDTEIPCVRLCLRLCLRTCIVDTKA
jgi:hypothetical protein